MQLPIGRAFYAFQLLLSEMVTSEGLVHYEYFSREELVARIGLVVREFKESSLPESSEEKMAFWCNTYNANVLFHVMMEREKPGFTTVDNVDGFFDSRPFTAAGELMYLNFLENERIRPMGDPRIHAVLVCAAKSCPPLRRIIFKADKLDSQFNDQCSRWVNDPSKNRVEDGKLLLSQIFNWYGKDFEVEPYGGVVGFVKHFAEPGGELATFLQANPAPAIEWMKYDWTLNQASAN